MDYNTQRKKMVLPEYGRNIQRMVDHLLTIEDREERNRAAQVVIDVMGNLYPHLRDVPDFRHKLWDHLAIMADFKLDIDSPYPLPERAALYVKPEPLKYNSNRIRYKHYGKSVEKLFDKIKELKDYPEQQRALLVLTANHMKKSFLTWNKDSVEDAQIYKDIDTYCKGIELPEGMMLSASRDLLQKKNNNNNKPMKMQGKMNNSKRYYKKPY